MSSDQLISILKKLNLTETKSYSTEDLKALANEGGVNHILTGSLSKAGEIYEINYNLQEIHEGKSIGSDSLQGEGIESILTMVDEMTKKIKQHLNLSQAQIADDIDIEIGITVTSSPEAYKYYLEGRKYHMNGNFIQSIPLMKRAISIDPEFALTFRSMAMSYSNIGFHKERREYLQKAFELSARLPDREKYWIHRDFYKESEKTWDKAIELRKTAAEQNPSALEITNLAGAYRNKGLYKVKGSPTRIRGQPCR